MNEPRIHYTSLSEATNGLRARGYTHDLNLKPDCIECPALQLQISPERFIVDEFYRFEGSRALMITALCSPSLQTMG